MTDKLVCMHCGHNKFKKQGVMSCSAVPPLFKCAKCDKYTRVPVNYEGNILIERAYINKHDEWFLHTECYECGSTEDNGGWHQESYIIDDPEGNPMYRKKILCPNCK